MAVTIRLFGPLRSLVADDELVIVIDPETSIGEVRKRLASELQELSPTVDLEILRASALADSKGIMRDTEKMGDRAELLVLPPVSGG